MKKGMLSLFFMFLVCGPASAGTEGHGGDLLRKLFSDARGLAAGKAQQLTLCSFDSTVDRSVRDWILARQSEYAADIQRSQQIWITDPQATCAFTRDQGAADITLSFESCRSLIRSEVDAAHILFHESVHHFGVADENFAEAVASAMDSAIAGKNCGALEEGPFNPQACSGQPISQSDFLSYFRAGGSPVRFNATAPVIFRHRKCLGDGDAQCSDWSYRTGRSWVGLGFSILSGQPLATVYLNGHITNDTERQTDLSGVGGDRVTMMPLGFALYWEGPEAVGFRFDGSGRLTKGCLVQRVRVNQELEAGFLLRY